LLLPSLLLTFLIAVTIFSLFGDRSKFHRDCASKAPPSCGLSDELVDKILKSYKDNGLQFLPFFVAHVVLFNMRVFIGSRALA